MKEDLVIYQILKLMEVILIVPLQVISYYMKTANNFLLGQHHQVVGVGVILIGKNYWNGVFIDNMN